ncbi:MAG: hypothetical protein JWN56_417 [Sphingobacteriales bacterium]|nr:hypothetical protein [Sphingobacteriales bacterium]
MKILEIPCNYKPKQIQKISSWLLLLLFSASILSSCKSKRKAESESLGSQPTIDSIYVTQYMNNDPAFKDELSWAKKFYTENKHQLGWFKNHQLVPEANQLLTVINKAADEGLNPEDYKTKDFKELLAELEEINSDSAKRNNLEKEIDVSLTGTYFKWASDYYRGVVIPAENKSLEWDVKKNKIKLHKALLTFLKKRKSKYGYASFQPLHTEYSNLKVALKKYRAIKAKGGWGTISASVNLKPGATSPDVPTLRKRFLSAQDSTSSPIYDDQLVAAVKAFQAQNNLKPSGILNSETVRLLNIPVEQRIRQVTINMERWRWIPKSFEPDYLLVNIPEFKLHVYEKKKEALSMKVIVGKVLNSTPIFSDKMETVVLSPYWNVPVSIVVNELQDKLISDPSYLDRLDMEVIDNRNNIIDYHSIDWASVTEDNFKYVIRRRPGPKNDLGDVKFVFPNSRNIYLHDTPNDELFSQSKRGFSHGCVRVEEPIKLAEYLLRNKPGWNRSKIMETVNMRKEQAVRLKQSLPVYLVYFTAEADSEGNVHFYDDLYGHDTKLTHEYFSKIN